MTERNFVIKVEDGFAYVREAERDYRDGTVNYRHKSDARVLLCGQIGPMFVSQLLLLLAEHKLADALDAKIQAEAEHIVHGESDMERDRR